jgi:hypothetical protein
MIKMKKIMIKIQNLLQIREIMIGMGLIGDYIYIHTYTYIYI